jgi:hypothetical protein
MKRFRVVSAIWTGALGVLVLVSVSARASAPDPAGAAGAPAIHRFYVKRNGTGMALES